MATRQINRKLDPVYLAGITGGGAPAGSTDDISSCFGKADKLPFQIIIKGPAATSDAPRQGACKTPWNPAHSLKHFAGNDLKVSKYQYEQ